jgi:hypothetical protein
MEKDKTVCQLERIADRLDDISRKLDHIIKKQTEDFMNPYSRWKDELF